MWSKRCNAARIVRFCDEISLRGGDILKSKDYNKKQPPLRQREKSKSSTSKSKKQKENPRPESILMPTSERRPLPRETRDPPLPPGWIRRLSRQHRRYYYVDTNQSPIESFWTFPEEGDQSQRMRERNDEDLLDLRDIDINPGPRDVPQSPTSTFVTAREELDDMYGQVDNETREYPSNVEDSHYYDSDDSYRVSPSLHRARLEQEAIAREAENFIVPPELRYLDDPPPYSPPSEEVYQRWLEDESAITPSPSRTPRPAERSLVNNTRNDQDFTLDELAPPQNESTGGTQPVYNFSAKDHETLIDKLTRILHIPIYESVDDRKEREKTNWSRAEWRVIQRARKREKKQKKHEEWERYTQQRMLMLESQRNEITNRAAAYQMYGGRPPGLDNYLEDNGSLGIQAPSSVTQTSRQRSHVQEPTPEERERNTIPALVSRLPQHSSPVPGSYYPYFRPEPPAGPPVTPHDDSEDPIDPGPSNWHELLPGRHNRPIQEIFQPQATSQQGHPPQFFGENLEGPEYTYQRGPSPMRGGNRVVQDGGTSSINLRITYDREGSPQVSPEILPNNSSRNWNGQLQLAPGYNTPARINGIGIYSNNNNSNNAISQVPRSNIEQNFLNLAVENNLRNSVHDMFVNEEFIQDISRMVSDYQRMYQSAQSSRDFE